MSKITVMDRDACRRVQAALGECFDFLNDNETPLSPLGVSLKVGRATYDPTAGVMTVKVEAGIVKADGSVASKDERDWKAYHTLLGLPADGLGRKCCINGWDYTVAGLAIGSRKYPVLMKRADGKVFKMSAWQIQKALNYDPNDMRGPTVLETK